MTLCRRRVRRILLGLPWIAYAASLDAAEPAWKVGSPVAIAVSGGRAEFDIPSRHQASKSLVIVSALTRMPGPFPIALTAMPRGSAQAVVVTSDGPSRTPVRLEKDPIEDLPPAQGSPPPLRSFHLLVRDGDPLSVSNYQKIEAKLAAVGTYIQVYVDPDDLATVSSATLREIIDTFDTTIYPVARRELWLARDVDGDGRFTVLVSSWLSKLAGGKTQVDGFVRGTDFDPEMNRPYGNHCDMMYLAARLEPGPHLKTVLAHEYTHAITFSQKALAEDGTRIGAEEEGWLDEALAHVVEDRYGFSRSNLDYRVSAFLSRPERYRLVVEPRHCSSPRYTGSSGQPSAKHYTISVPPEIDDSITRSFTSR